MQEWFWFSLISAALYGATVSLDKINLNKYFRNPLHIMPLNGVVMLVALMLLIAIFPLSIIPANILIIAFFAGFLYFLGNVFYYKALFIEEATSISAFLRLIPIFVLIFGFLFLNERFGMREYAGIILLIAGSYGISIKNRIKFEINKPLFLMVCASFFYAAWFVVIKYLLDFSDYFAIFIYGMLGLAICSILTLLLRGYRKHAIALARKHPVKPLFLYSLATIFNLGGEGATFVALSAGFVSLVSALQASQAFFSMVLGIGLTLFAPHLLKEEMKKSVLVRKIIFIIVIVIGAYLVA